MNYIVLDLEWNQAFSKKLMVKKPVRLVGEIVQIGAVKLDFEFRISDMFKTMISPKYYTKMHGKVSRLTHIKSEDLKSGVAFADAIADFRRWCGDDFCFITWGWDDIRILKDNFAVNGIDDSWLPDVYNLQIIYDNQVSHEGRQVALGDAVQTLGLENLAKDAHDALNDAYNTALICPHLDMKTGLEKYEELTGHFQFLNTAAALNPEGRRYEKYTDALKDSDILQFRCEGCGETAEFGKLLEQSRHSKYISVAKCECGEEYFLRLKLRRNEDGTTRASKNIYKLTDELRALYENRQKKLKKYRLAKKRFRR